MNLEGGLESVVSGDLTHLEDLGARPLHDLREAAEHVDLTVTPEAVRRVLRELVDGRASPAQVQVWASFIRRGYFANSGSGPITPLELPYDQVWEDQIVEAISRMDEIGDQIDGEISPEEAAELIRSLF